MIENVYFSLEMGVHSIILWKRNILRKVHAFEIKRVCCVKWTTLYILYAYNIVTQYNIIIAWTEKAQARRKGWVRTGVRGALILFISIIISYFSSAFGSRTTAIIILSRLLRFNCTNTPPPTCFICPLPSRSTGTPIFVPTPAPFCCHCDAVCVCKPLCIPVLLNMWVASRRCSS